MAKTSGRKFHTGRETELRVTGKLRVGLTVMQEVLRRDRALDGGEQVLGSYTMTYRGAMIRY